MTAAWDFVFAGPTGLTGSSCLCIKSPCPCDSRQPLPGEDHSVWIAQRDATLRAAEAKHAVAAAAGDFGQPTLLERAAVSASKTLEATGLEASAKKALAAAAAAPGQLADALPSVGLAAAGIGAVALVVLVLVLRRG